MPNSSGDRRDSEQDPTDWPELGRRFQDIEARLIHGEGEPVRSGKDFHGEALRRLLTSDSGWMTRADHDRRIRAHHVFSGSAAEIARRQAREARKRYAVSARAMRAELAAWLREVGSSERVIPSRYRRDGVLLAADWIDPATSAWPYKATTPERVSVPADGGDQGWSQVLAALRAAGEQTGKQAAVWWAQYTLASHEHGDLPAVARAVLAGIDACDPTVLACLPAFDVTGYDAERYRVQAPHGAPEWGDLTDAEQAAAIDAARDGFTTAVDDGVAARCADLINGHPHPTG